MGIYPTNKYRIRITPSDEYAEKPPFKQKTIEGKNKFNKLALKLINEGYEIKATNIAFCSVAGSRGNVERIISQVPI